ncbi:MULTISPECIES: ATP-binding cassette domain-containing protein [unclassified Pseudoalteromonas]|uniref:ATP-binding cassette domain-containing protein n=1 Tax=unclassified Pseudoalteromonas TaxID=194690 RepID=UPI0014320725|nr:MULTISPECIES: ATP-binding cassette domain-containing protein [unclassified Pseudoalteromonas]MCP4587397.1 ATP-binding cassette domain-containing protein [Pseudoalteromonas sp.]NIZ04846.1 ATP-binding cassette domain-containing protein [Pseudoalteromonas sp. HF66]URQ89206.1 ATP-binding cassette domain-containing protein [Pseudoalteromonas sp. SCSIO 43101]
MIEINNLNKRFASAHVFKNYSKQFQNKKVCLQAANGRGKTTLLMMLAGLEKPQSGVVLYNNQALKSPQNDVSIASDRITLPDFLTARQIIELSCNALKKDMPEQLITGFNFTEHFNTRFSALSSGNQKKCQLITAFLKQAPFLLLDEPSAALDQISIKFLLTILDSYLDDKPNGQVIITSHEPEVFIQHGFECTSL